MSMIDSGADELRRQRNILAGGDGTPRSKTFNVLSELFGNKGRLSQVDQQQAVSNTRQVEQDAFRQDQRQIDNARQVEQDRLNKEQQEFSRDFRTEGRELDVAQQSRNNARQDDATFRKNTAEDLKISREAQDEVDDNTLKTATFLQMHAEQGTLDAEVFERAGQALESLGIPVEEYGPIFEQAMADPSVLPAYIETLTKKTKGNASRIKIVGKPEVWTRGDGSQFSRSRFDDNSFEDTEIEEGTRRNKDILAGRRATVSEGTQDVELQEQLAGGKKKGAVVGEELGKRAIEGFDPTPKQVRIGTQLHSKAIDEADALISNIEKAIGMVGRNNTGPIQGDPEGKIGSLLAGTVSLNAIIENVKSNEFLNTISQLKAASKTGATGLGQIAQFEALATSNKRAALDQKQQPEELTEQLSILLEAVRADKDRLDGAYDADYVAPFEEDPFDAEVNAILESVK